MFCPQCGKEIGGKQKFCAECGKPLACAAASETPEVKKAKSIPAWRWAIYGPLCVAALVFVVYSVAHQPETEHENAEFVRQMATLQVEKPQWNEISRTLIVSQSFDLHGYFGWLHDPLNPASSSLKVFLVPHSAASDPDRVMFVIMDEQNAERMRAGYPPVVLASSPITGTKEVELPYGRRYWFGFVELATKPDAPGSIPTSALGAAIYLLNQYQKQSNPPIRLTAEIYSSAKLYATPTEARRQMLALRQKESQATDEARAVAGVRTIAAAVVGFCNAYLHPPSSLSDLATANLINSDLASGRLAGFSVAVQAIDCGLYNVTARPVAWDPATSLSLYLDETGGMHETRENRPATRSDPVMEPAGQ